MTNIIARFWVSLVMGILVWVPVLALAAAMPEYTLVIKDHHFEPASLKIAANTKVKVIIDNQDASAEEFESAALKREKLIKGGKKATILLGPLAPGTYAYTGEFHQETARGEIIAQ